METKYETTLNRQAKIKAALALPTELLAGKLVQDFNAELEFLRKTPKLDREQLKLLHRIRETLIMVEGK
mgnify:CR=1 FL=1